MSDESKTMDRSKFIATLQQIKALTEECLRAVGEKPEPKSRKKELAQARSPGPVQVDFDKPVRPFMKSYAKGLSGPKKFALLLSWLGKGDLKKEVALSEIEKRWNGMTAILEMEFNRFFAAEAKDNDWVESKKRGQYNLRPAWRDILKSKGKK
jgi:hypothetical protein